MFFLVLSHWHLTASDLCTYWRVSNWHYVDRITWCVFLPISLATWAATSACLYWLWGRRRGLWSDVRVVPRFSSPRNALPDKYHSPENIISVEKQSIPRHSVINNRFCFFYWPIPLFSDHRYHRALWLVGLAPTVFFLNMGAVTLSVSLLLHLGLHLGNHLLHSSKLWNTKHCHVEQKHLHSNMQTMHFDHWAQV